MQPEKIYKKGDGDDTNVTKNRKRKNSLTAFSFIDRPYSKSVSSSVSQHIPRERTLAVDDHLGSGTFKDVFNASVDNKHKQLVLSRFKGNFNAKAVDDELRFAGELYQHGLCTLPTHIKRRRDDKRWVTIKEYLDTPFDVDTPEKTLDTGAEFLTQKLVCGTAMYTAMGGLPNFFIALRALCQDLIDNVDMVYVDVKVDNVCYDPKTQSLKIVDVDKQFFRSPSNIGQNREHWINYMLFQTWVIEYLWPNPLYNTNNLIDATLTKPAVLSMLNILKQHEPEFNPRPIGGNFYHSPMFELWHYTTSGKGVGQNVITYSIFSEPNVTNIQLYEFIMDNNRQVLSGGRRRTIRRKSLRNKKSRKNGKK